MVHKDLLYNKKYQSRPEYKEQRKKYDQKYRSKPERKEHVKQYRLELKLKCYNHYSNYDIKCICCGERHIEFLTIDHINNDGSEHRKNILGGNGIHTWLIKNNFPPGFQIMCFNCNFAKSIDEDHLCIHQKELFQINEKPRSEN